MIIPLTHLETHSAGHTGYLNNQAFPLLETPRVEDTLQNARGFIRVAALRESSSGYTFYYAAVKDLPTVLQAAAALHCARALWERLEYELDSDRMLLEPHWALGCSQTGYAFRENVGLSLGRVAFAQHAVGETSLELDRAHALGRDSTLVLLARGDFDAAFAQYRFTPESWSRFERDAPTPVDCDPRPNALPGETFSRAYFDSYFDTRDIPGIYDLEAFRP